MKSRWSWLPATLVLVLVVGGGLMTFGNGSSRTVVANFGSVVGLYEGSEVRVQGVRVGQVRSIVPTRTGIRVTLEYEKDVRLPPSVKAVVVSPSVIADRFVQLTPAYISGATLADGASLSRKQTAVPVELDDVLASTDQMLTALGPSGANKNGSLSRLLDSSARSVSGLADDIHQSLANSADLADTLATSRGDLAATVDGLNEFTAMLAKNDHAVGTFTDRLAEVSDFLADDRAQISDVLEALAASLGDIQEFVRTNRKALANNVSGLREITQALVDERKALTEVLELAPLGFDNLNRTYDGVNGAVRSRANVFDILRNVDQIICTALTNRVGAVAAAPACSVLTALIDGKVPSQISQGGAR